MTRIDNSSTTHIAWIDLLRIIACFAVVVSHCCDGFVGAFDSDRVSFLTGVWIGSLMRPSVPLFVMMTGVLLLPIPKHYTLNGFYKKRVLRVVLALIFWSLILPICSFLYYNFINPLSLNPLVDSTFYTSESLIGKLTTWIFNFNFDTVPLWYIYMLIGLYLIMPVINNWLLDATKKDIRTVLILWGGSLALPYIKMVAPILGYQGNYGNYELLGGCDWNPYNTFYYLSGFIGYVILAFYLKKYPINWNICKTLVICIPLFILGYVITAYGYVLTQSYYPGNYAYLEIVWYFCGINVFMMTFPIFVIVQKLSMKPSRFLSAIAGTTFGIYLCHYIWVFITFDWFNTPALPYAIRIILMSVATFIITLVISYILGLIPFTRRFVK